MEDIIVGMKETHLRYTQRGPDAWDYIGKGPKSFGGLCFRVSEVPLANNAGATIPKVQYELPDGTSVALGEERFAVPEALFMPNEPNSIARMAADVIDSCDVDLRRELCQSVVLTGGNSLIQGFGKRLEKDLLGAVSSMGKVRSVSAPAGASERKSMVWLGASILASLGTLQQMWISRQEYADSGASLVHRKCP